MSLLSGFVDVASEWLLAAVSVIGGGVLSLTGLVRNADKRSKRNERRLEGDPENPNHDGVMALVRENKDVSEKNGRKIDHLEDRIEDQHRAVLDRIEDLDDSNND